MTEASNQPLHPDRLLPTKEPELSIARDLYESVKDAPIVSPHGHVPIEWFARDLHFDNPTELFITPDHYVTRVLHAQGVALEDLGVAQQSFTGQQARNAFLLLGRHWRAFAGTPMRYWFEDALERVFGITTRFGGDTAGAIYDELDALLAQPEFSTRSLIKRFNIDFISTTDDPIDDLSLHEHINDDPDFQIRVAPAFRPDRYLEVGRPGWPSLVRNLGAVAGVDATDYSGFTEAMRIRRRYFKDHGAVLSDHSHADVGSERLSDELAASLFAKAMDGRIETDEAVRLRRHLFNDQASMAQHDGLVMTVHPAVHRDYDRLGLKTFGHDIGADIPGKAEFAVGLEPLLNEYGNNPDFHFVAFTIDETVYSRELAPLAGYYPSVYVGAPWWFIDAPESIERYFAAVVPYAGFTKLSGFIDDTRALCSIPSRHDMNRRVTAGYIAKLVADHRISKDEGLDLVRYAISMHPREVFKL
jgi:glucuronate isomerase